jgi:hypothetical protein
VVSTSTNKTAVVAVERLSVHTEYAKRVRITKKYIAHDETNECKVREQRSRQPGSELPGQLLHGGAAAQAGAGDVRAPRHARRRTHTARAVA